MSSLEVILSVMTAGESLPQVSFVDSWGWGRRSMQLLTHTLARFLATLRELVSPATGREPYRVADIIMNGVIFFVVSQMMEQELFAAEVR